MMRTFFYLYCILFLSACNSSADKEIISYIQKINARKASTIPPIPAYIPITPFTYPQSLLRRNPFQPKTLAAEHKDKFAPNTERIKEPLEAFPLDALKFVGILKNGPLFYGLVSQPDGLINQVKIGDYIGKNFGKITAIDEFPIKIQETIKNLDLWEQRPIELKLKIEPQSNVLPGLNIDKK